MLTCTAPGCGKVLPREAFSQSQKDAKGGERFCPTCVEQRLQEQKDKDKAKHAVKTCCPVWGCGEPYPKDDFSRTQLDRGDKRLCRTCVKSMLRCPGCTRSLTRRCYRRCEEETPNHMTNSDKRRCNECLTKFEKPGMLRCPRCTRSLPRRCYSKCQKETPSYMQNSGKRRCDECKEEFAEELRRQSQTTEKERQPAATGKRSRKN